MFNLTPLGIFHTFLSVAAVALAFVVLARDKRVSTGTRIGQLYVFFLVITCLTGFPIVRHGAIGPPHILGVITLVALAVAFAAERFRAFGGWSTYVMTIGYSATVLFLMIPTFTETLTRLPPSAPLVASPESPPLLVLNGILLAIFLAAVTVQVRALRATARG